MTSLVDVSTGSGSSANAIKELTEAVAALPGANQRQQTGEDRASNSAARADKRFEGKTADDIIDMYKNLEQHGGRLANQVGQQQQAINELLAAKRQNDLAAHGGDVTVNASDLLDDPTEAIDKLVSDRARKFLAPIEQRLAQQEANLAHGRFEQTHADYDEITKSNEFREWANKTNLRKYLTNQAAQGNWDSANSLITEYKDSRPAKGQSVGDTALDAAGRVSLESSRTASDAGVTRAAGKIYKSSDLMALRINNPDAYEKPEFAKEIEKAYREGRVDRNR